MIYLTSQGFSNGSAVSLRWKHLRRSDKGCSLENTLLFNISLFLLVNTARVSCYSALWKYGHDRETGAAVVKMYSRCTLEAISTN
jgi:hypothetical protein